jgi:hypothetical protein
MLTTWTSLKSGTANGDASKMSSAASSAVWQQRRISSVQGAKNSIENSNENSNKPTAPPRASDDAQQIYFIFAQCVLDLDQHTISFLAQYWFGTPKGAFPQLY